jgi:hypothetical protein
LPDTDLVISVTREQSSAISGPGKGNALGVQGLLTTLEEFGGELVNNGLGLEIPDLDARSSGSAEPVTVGGEDKGVDNVTSLKRVQVLRVVKIPEHNNAVLTTGSAEGTIGRDGDGVDVTGVTNVVGSELALGKLPNLDNLVPTSGNDDGVGRVGGEANAGNPLGVTILLDVELALTKGVPQLDGLVTGSRDNLTVVRGERDGQNIVGVTDETAGGGAGVQVPKTKGLVPGGGQSELAIRGDNNVLNEVVVAGERLTGNTVAGLISGKVPDDDGLVCKEQLWKKGVMSRLAFSSKLSILKIFSTNRGRQTRPYRGPRRWWQWQ